MVINEKNIAARLEALHKWQEDNSERVHSDSFLEGYNSAVNAEILYLHEMQNRTEADLVVAPVVEAPAPVVKTVKKTSK
jgi:hypothetical protein